MNHEWQTVSFKGHDGYKLVYTIQFPIRLGLNEIYVERQRFEAQTPPPIRSESPRRTLPGAGPGMVHVHVYTFNF